jgi:hypothetical protein
MNRDDMLRPADLPMQPSDYLRRRRLLQGLTIAQAARPHWVHPQHQADVERNWRTFETPRHVMKPYVARSLEKGLNFSVDIYLQLADLPAFHPTICRCCGSDEAEPRTTHEGFAAKLDEERICTACREDMQARDMRRAAA